MVSLLEEMVQIYFLNYHLKVITENKVLISPSLRNFLNYEKNVLEQKQLRKQT